MQLNQYPTKIREYAIEILDQEKSARDQQAIFEAYMLQVETAIAFDTELKNDAQRKVKRGELMAHESCIELQTQLQDMKDHLTFMRIFQQSLIDGFAVAKIEARLLIVAGEAIAA